jgi:nucleoid DNA-binding protein
MALAKLRKNDKRIKTFVQEVTSSLVIGKKHQVPGLGTFSTCSRKDSSGRSTCKIAMFRPSAELRDFASGGAYPSISGPHEEAVRYIIESMKNEEGVEIPHFGRMAVVPVKGKSPKLIFHGSEELNETL